MRFNEAYLAASNEMEEYIERQRRFNETQERKVQADKRTVTELIEQHYQSVERAIESAKEQVKQVEEKLIKLKKGSIKTLIFFYSGDITLEAEQV